LFAQAFACWHVRFVSDVYIDEGKEDKKAGCREGQVQDCAADNLCYTEYSFAACGIPLLELLGYFQGLRCP